MHCQELATAVEQESPFLAVVLNDKTLASIRNAQLKKYGKDYGTSFKLDVNLADVASAFGAEGWTIEVPPICLKELGRDLRVQSLLFWTWLLMAVRFQHSRCPS